MERPATGRFDRFGKSSANGRFLRIPAGRFRRILFSNGSRRKLLRGVDAFGCLRSLRARSALDGVSWVQRGSVESAVGLRLALATESAPSSAPSLERRSSWELVSASCLVARAYADANSVPSRSIACMVIARRRARATRALRIVDRWAIAKPESLSLSWPL